MSALLEFHAPGRPEIRLLQGDLDAATWTRARRAKVVAWDIETSGLDWADDRIATVQVLVDDTVAIVQVGAGVPARLKALLEDAAVTKLFHHAMFDLRFMVHHWGALPTNIACTKVAAKLAHRDEEPSAYSLLALVRRHVGVTLDKGAQVSDWAAADLDARQIAYAAADVAYLRLLHDDLARELRAAGRLALRDACYAHLPARVALELGRFGDVYAY